MKGKDNKTFLKPFGRDQENLQPEQPSGGRLRATIGNENRSTRSSPHYSHYTN